MKYIFIIIFFKHVKINTINTESPNQFSSYTCSSQKTSLMSQHVKVVISSSFSKLLFAETFDIKKKEHKNNLQWSSFNKTSGGIFWFLSIILLVPC